MSSWKRDSTHTLRYVFMLHAYKNMYVVEKYLWNDMWRCTVPSIISYGWASGIHEVDDGPQVISWECCTLRIKF